MMRMSGQHNGHETVAQKNARAVLEMAYTNLQGKDQS